MKKIVLASASPRRKELLEKIGLKFVVEPSNGEEGIDSGLEPHELVRQISIKKAKIVAARYENAIIIAADTIGAFKRILRVKCVVTLIAPGATSE